MQPLNGSFSASFNRSFTKKHPLFYKSGSNCNLAPPPRSLMLHCSSMFCYFVVFRHSSITHVLLLCGVSSLLYASLLCYALPFLCVSLLYYVSPFLHVSSFLCALLHPLCFIIPWCFATCSCFATSLYFVTPLPRYLSAACCFIVLPCFAIPLMPKFVFCPLPFFFAMY